MNYIKNALYWIIRSILVLIIIPLGIVAVAFGGLCILVWYLIDKSENIVNNEDIY